MYYVFCRNFWFVGMWCISLTIHISDDDAGDAKSKSSVPTSTAKASCTNSTSTAASASDTECILVLWSFIVLITFHPSESVNKYLLERKEVVFFSFSFMDSFSDSTQLIGHQKGYGSVKNPAAAISCFLRDSVAVLKGSSCLRGPVYKYLSQCPCPVLILQVLVLFLGSQVLVLGS